MPSAVVCFLLLIVLYCFFGVRLACSKGSCYRSGDFC